MENKFVKSICPVCSRRCTVELELAGEEIVSVRPLRSEGFEGCCGYCVKGALGHKYRGRADRLLTPLRRVGERGYGRFEPIGWDEAIAEIAGRLLALRSEHGANSVAFYTGYTKWYRPMLQRLASDFGSVNYGTESSACQRSCIMANICDTGLQAQPDYKNAGVLLVTARRRLMPGARAAAKAGTKIIVVDPGTSPDIENYADLHLRPRPGTDIALAYGIARRLIVSGRADMDYIEKYVHGFEAYRDRAMLFTPEKVESLTGVSAAEVVAAADMIADNLPMSLQEGFTGLIHHRNGMQGVRAWNALCAVTGCYGRPGGNIPNARLRCDGYGESRVRTFELAHPCELDASKRIGAERFPLWNALLDECQAMDFPNALRGGKLRAIFALGMNARMFPDSETIFEVLKGLDFYVDCDIFLSDSAHYADIVLPVSVSYEREQLAFVGGDKKLWLHRRAVAPLGECRSDEDIIIDLARAMQLGDELFDAGKEKCWEYLLEGSGISLAELREADAPVPIPPPAMPKPLEDGFPTPSGKFELYSEAIAAACSLDPLPQYIEPLADQNRGEYPLCLMAGVRSDRYAHALHSRTHTVAEIRAIRPEAAVDVHPEDAAALDIAKGDRVLLETAFGSIEVGVDIDGGLLRGCVNMYHGYSEADVNTLIPGDYLDPYSGFPGYKAIACRIRKKD